MRRTLFLCWCLFLWPCLSAAQNHLTFTAQPQATPPGQTIPPVTVQIQDAGGNPQPGASATIVLRLDFTPTLLPFSQLSVVSVDSEETTCATNPATFAIDGNTSTFWHTAYCSGSPPPPHTLTLGLGATVPVIGFRELPRQDGSTNGQIAGYTFDVSPTGTAWDAPLAQGTLPTSATEQQIIVPSMVESLAWDYNTTPPLVQTGFVVGRCTVVSPAASCNTFVDLANGTTGPTTLAHLDATAAPGTSYCYQVQAMDATQRSPGVSLCRSIGPKLASQVRLIETSEQFANAWASAAEVGVLQGVLLNGTRSKATSSGTGSWTDLTITTPGTYALTAFAPGFAAVTSAPFVITSAVGAATHLGFEVQPASTVIGQTMQSVIVRVLDVNESLVTSTVANVTIALAGGVSPPPLQGTTVVATVSGRATFSTVSLPPQTVPGTYTLTATTPGLTGASSTPFVATAPLAAPTNVQWKATRTSRTLCSAFDGDANDLATQGIAEHIHSLTCTLPANSLSTGSTLRVCTLLRLQTGTTTPGWSLALLADNVVLENSVPVAFPTIVDTTSWACLQLQSHAPPSSAVLTSSALETYLPTAVFSVANLWSNRIAQPVLLALSGPVVLKAATTWGGAGTGPNILTQLGFFVEELP